MSHGTGMLRYALRRLIASVPVLLGVLVLVFLLLHLAPGDPTVAYFHPDVPPEVADRLREQMGLDRPLPVQFVLWLGAFVQGEFGYSFLRGEPVSEALAAALPDTLLLGGAALLLVFTCGVAVGAWQAWRRGRLAEDVASVATLVAYSVPGFWAALLLVLLFSSSAVPEFLRLPVTGATSVGHGAMGPGARLLDHLRHLLLPALALSLAPAAGVARYTRGSLLEALEQGYVRAARARGLGEARVVVGHALRNALLPVVSLLGLWIPALLGGTVIIETVFAWPGMGRLLYDAVLARDFPVVLAASFVYGMMAVAGSLVADLLYGVVDPRVRSGGDVPAARP